MHQAALQQTTDLDATPEGRHALPIPAPLLEPGLQRLVGGGAVVIGHRQVLEPQAQGLRPQLLRPQTAVAVDGVTVKIQLVRAAGGMHLLKHRPEGMGSVLRVGGHREPASDRRRVPFGPHAAATRIELD